MPLCYYKEMFVSGMVVSLLIFGIIVLFEEWVRKWLGGEKMKLRKIIKLLPS